MSYSVLRLREAPWIKERAAQWFHEKWGIPLAAYRESMGACLSGGPAVPQWYLALEGERLIGGLGVIENDYHERKDLSPNVCAVYVEEDRRRRGGGGALLAVTRGDRWAPGMVTRYLVRHHLSFYERYGWELLCMARGDDGELMRLYVHRS